MDSNSDSCETYSPKIEPDWETDREVYKKDPRLNWNSENTMKLIETIERECKELWDTKHPLNKDRSARQAKHEYLANMFGTTSEEISRKIHNLRTQFNNEVRKIKRKQSFFGEGSGATAGGSGWEYFEALSFLMREPLTDPMENVDGVNLALAEFQADEEEQFGAAARARQLMNANLSPRSRGIKGHAPLRVAASAPPPLPPSANPVMWPEEPLLRLRPTVNADECQIFGDFVASELRTLRSNEARKRLKRVIQKAILEIGDEEDINIITG